MVAARHSEGFAVAWATSRSSIPSAGLPHPGATESAGSMRSRRLRWLLFVVPVAIALALGLAAANRFAGPFPPRTITIATGREEGA